jgi:two-component system response regulator AtoC
MAAIDHPLVHSPDSPMESVYVTLEKVLDHPATVLIEGESGTGKDALACWLHYNSNRRDRPLIKINLAALPEDLIESELFGYERGAFTGAAGTKLELAQAGTLVLDEIAGIGTHLQSKLLEVVESKTVYRLGGTRPVNIDARIVAISSTGLTQAVQDGTFRQDLFFRLNLITVILPPLRQRTGELVAIAGSLLEEAQRKHGRSGYTLAAECQAVLKRYPFPGNLRELRNGLERAVLSAPGTLIRPPDLPDAWRARNRRATDLASLEDVEREHIRRVLDHTRGRKQVAADILGITRKTLLEKRKKYGMD